MVEGCYRENYAIVYGYLLSLCADPALAEELAAEAFCKAIEHIGEYDPRYRASTWLCTIGRNLFYNECRRTKRFTGLEEAQWMAVPSAEDIHLQKEQARQVLEQLAGLPPLSRQVMVMHLQGMSHREIALALDKSENWVRVTFFRAKARIKQGMEDAT